jgi:hypothetical protein
MIERFERLSLIPGPCSLIVNRYMSYGREKREICVHLCKSVSHANENGARG